MSSLKFAFDSPIVLKKPGESTGVTGAFIDINAVVKDGS
jgi:hypothetical protein